MADKNQNPMKEIEHGNNKVQILDDGSVKIIQPNGNVLELDANGDPKINMPKIKKVGIDNIFDLNSYLIIRESDLNIHQIHLDHFLYVL